MNIDDILSDLPPIENEAPVLVAESWRPVDLAPVANGTVVNPEPSLLRFRGSTKGLLYPGAVNGLHGDSGDGKTWLALAAVAEQIRDGNHVLYLDFEATAAELVARLEALGLAAAQIVAHLDYVRPDVLAGLATVEMLTERIAATNTTLVVIDSLGDAFAVWGLDENKDADVGPWFREFPRALADAGPAVNVIDHATKAKESPLFPSGSKRKRAAISGASYLVTGSPPPTRDRPGRLLVTCAKDRHGTYRRGEIVANVDVTPYPDGGVTIAVWEPAPDTTAEQEHYVLAKRLVQWIKDQERPVSKNEIEGSGVVKARAARIRAALDKAEAEGAIEVTVGRNRAHLYRYVKDLEDRQP